MEIIVRMNSTHLKLTHHKSNLIITITPRRHMNTKHRHNTQSLAVHTQREDKESSSSGSSSSSSGTAAASTRSPRLLHESRASNNGGLLFRRSPV